jgi:hypothetical protein
MRRLSTNGAVIPKRPHYELDLQHTRLHEENLRLSLWLFKKKPTEEGTVEKNHRGPWKNSQIELKKPSYSTIQSCQPESRNRDGGIAAR